MTNTFSHFNLLGELGGGGMGKVYLAEDTELNRKVVLKFLPSQLASRQSVVDRFKREARAAAALKHPNIVTVYELSRCESGYYLAMEFVDGISLDNFMRKREISLNKAIEIVIQLCRGLRKAHQQGVVHRDIKPSNVMIDRDGWVKILDFGLAKLNDVTRLTKVGMRMGTIQYMSPEQVKGEELDKRSDIFSLGIVLYQLITQNLPFKGDSDDSVMYSIVHRNQEPMAKYKTGVPDSLQRIIDKALDKDLEMRYQHVDDLMSDLKREKRTFMNRMRPVGQPHPARKTGSKGPIVSNPQSDKKRRLMAPLKALLLLAAISTAGLYFWGYPEKLDRLRSGVDRLVTESPVPAAEPMQLSAMMNELTQISHSGTLVRKLNRYSQVGLISLGKQVDRTALESCYIFLVEGEKVKDVFKIRDNRFLSVKNRSSIPSLSKPYPQGSTIWIQEHHPEAQASKF